MAFRRTADRIIDHAHGKIAGAEMLLAHAYTEKSKVAALDQLASAQRYLARAIAERDAWDAVDHDEYEEYPHVSENDMDVLI
jgi:hypothetical protein